jgi:uncharacterized tellurite resistance protein B-like protein
MNKTNTELHDRLKDVDEVISDPLRFKAKLAIGEDAYKMLRMKNKASQVMDTKGAVGTGVGIAQSAFIANTFFASSSIWSFIGIGSAAVTPVGWVVAAGVLSGAAWYGVSSKVQDASNDRTTVIPHFINTPMDALGVSLFGLIAPLAMKIANIDQEIHNLERDQIYRYLHREWGFNEEFLRIGLIEIEENIDEYYIQDLSSAIINFTKENPDCNQKMIVKDILKLLRDVMHADGVIDPREKEWIDSIELWLKGKSAKESFKEIFSNGLITSVKCYATNKPNKI